MTETDPRERLARFATSRVRYIVPIALVALVVVGLLWWHFSGRESTDDAQVDGHITQIAPKVGGVVLRVAVRDNQPVAAGTLLVEIDPRDYQVALTRAEADLATARGRSRSGAGQRPHRAHREDVGREFGAGRRRAGRGWRRCRDA